LTRDVELSFQKYQNFKKITKNNCSSSIAG